MSPQFNAEITPTTGTKAKSGDNSAWWAFFTAYTTTSKDALKDAPHRVLGVLLHYANGPESQKRGKRLLEDAFPGNENIMAATGYSKSTVIRCLNELQEAGWIVLQEGRKGGRGHATAYRLTVPTATGGPVENSTSDTRKGVTADTVSSLKGVNSEAQRVSGDTRKGVNTDTPPNEYLMGFSPDQKRQASSSTISPADVDNFAGVHNAPDSEAAVFSVDASGDGCLMDEAMENHVEDFDADAAEALERLQAEDVDNTPTPPKWLAEIDDLDRGEDEVENGTPLPAAPYAWGDVRPQRVHNITGALAYHWGMPT